MPRFSVRNGIVAPRTVLQVDDLDAETRIHIWNVVYALKMDSYDHYAYLEKRDAFVSALWVEWSRSFDDLHSTSAKEFMHEVKASIVEGTMAQAFDVIELCLEHDGTDLSDLLNLVFEKYLVGYRVVNGEIIQVTEGAEVEAIETALELLEPHGGARKHLLNALSLLSNRQDPHHLNVVKESISAVEAVARHLTGAKTLGEALKKLEANGVPSHHALVDGWLKIYGYVNDEGGIRHGSIKHGEVDEALATYFLVTCSSMAGYLIKKAGTHA
ncbi:AbiJ-NTD4 domain-containing protein [Arthrobacter sp. PAMC25284]|uniref:AbiJ-NTD4 domain-containing protein n=1 Tax=Arthrobacter sp. PAMC25284 TaxID=2861279 RepID=UPI001C62876F|nr:hypothetical protein [Arthrobacter sp. PAMC25284]QYF88555.1 hypothetical protein KY499_09750 [Arthrobacter sp. PAMC25284]